MAEHQNDKDKLSFRYNLRSRKTPIESETVYKIPNKIIEEFGKVALEACGIQSQIGINRFGLKTAE